MNKPYFKVFLYMGQLKTGQLSLVPLSRRSHAARCRVWSFSTKIPKNTTYTSDHLDHLEELPGNHLVGGYGPPPGVGIGTLH